MSKRVVCEWCGHSKSIAKDVDKAYAKGRSDAIEEITEIMKQYVDFENIDVFVEALRQLKEQNNDKF